MEEGNEKIIKESSDNFSSCFEAHCNEIEFNENIQSGTYTYTFSLSLSFSFSLLAAPPFKPLPSYFIFPVSLCITEWRSFKTRWSIPEDSFHQRYLTRRAKQIRWTLSTRSSVLLRTVDPVSSRSNGSLGPRISPLTAETPSNTSGLTMR